MGKKTVVWTPYSNFQMFMILEYYTDRNKSSEYSLKLFAELEKILEKLEFNITLPQKSNLEDVFYFTYNHISVVFSFNEINIVVLATIDDRRNPRALQNFLNKL